MPYKIEKFRTIKHGMEEFNAYCRQCKYNIYKKTDASKEAKNHSKKTLHTVDIYRENHTEYTCHFK